MVHIRTAGIAAKILKYCILFDKKPLPKSSSHPLPPPGPLLASPWLGPTPRVSVSSQHPSLLGPPLLFNPTPRNIHWQPCFAPCPALSICKVLSTIEQEHIFISLLIMYFYVLIYLIYLLPVGCKVLEGREPGLFGSFRYRLKQCLVHSRCSVHMCRINGCFSTPLPPIRTKISPPLLIHQHLSLIHI